MPVEAVHMFLMRRGFRNLTIDSTAVKANRCRPTGSTILAGLLTWADRLGQKLDTFGLKNFKRGWVPRWLEDHKRIADKRNNRCNEGLLVYAVSGKSHRING